MVDEQSSIGPERSKSSWLWFIPVAAALAAIFGLIFYLPKGKDPFTPSGPLMRIVGVDSSGSAVSDWKHYCSYTGRLAASLYSATDSIHIFHFEKTCNAYPTQIPKDPEDLETALFQELSAFDAKRKRLPLEKQKGSRPALFLEAVDNLLKVMNDDRPVEIIMMWDGGDDYSSYQHYDELFAKHVNSLAKNKRITRLIVWGIRPQNYDTVVKRLEPFGSRMVPFRNTEELKL